jgi:hypothetical protein
MMHIPTCDRLWKEFLDKYTKDFDITEGDLMETFLGMQVEQSKKAVRLRLDNYIKELLDEYKAYATKSLHAYPTRTSFDGGRLSYFARCKDTEVLSIVCR